MQQQKQQRRFQFALCALAVLLFGQSATAVASSSSSSSSSTAVPLGSICADGSTPLNSLQVRCDVTPQLHWAGRKCNNASHVCPLSYSCGATGLCCKDKDSSFVANRLCRQAKRTNKPASLVIGGSCSSDNDCSSSAAVAHKCCSGSCVRIEANCFRMLSAYLLLQSTGKMPRHHLPICNADGTFTRVQTDPRLGVSWCVNAMTGLALRSGCCLPKAKPQICPAGQRVNSCPRDMCSMHICEADPSAKCRVNPCGSGCTVEFVNSSGKLVNCSSGVKGCALKKQNFFTNLARIHRLDQTIPYQNYHFYDSAGENWELLEKCERQLCIRYAASLLEPESPTTAPGTVSNQCPSVPNLGYRCTSKCSRRSGSSNSCSSGTKCCFNGCGFECVRPVAMETSLTCNAVISSGHCPDSGCHRMCKVFGWDKAKGKCRPFWYAGAGGNNNRYKTYQDCMYAFHQCHTESLISLPWRPECRGSKDASFNPAQLSDNGFAWCVNASGFPTAGSLHTEQIPCKSDGSLMKDDYYFREEQKYIAKCPSGKAPAWCHETKLDPRCQSPGVMTFADACNDCKLVHINEDGDRVSCFSAAAVCSGDTEACQSPQPRFAFNSGTGKCDSAPVGRHRCHSNGSLSDHAAFRREDYCLHACSASICGTGSTQPKFFPDLCVAPSCSKPGTTCVADDCAGTERYVFLENGTEVIECRRSSQPLDLAAISSCGSASTPPAASSSSTGSPPPTRSSPSSSASLPSSSASSPSSSASSPTRPLSPRPSSRPSPPSTPSTTPSSRPTSSARPTRPVPPRPSSRPSPSSTPSATPSSRSRPSSRPPPSASSSTTSTSRTTASLVTSSGLCSMISLLTTQPLTCSSNGQFLPKQCNSTHCYCVFVDSGDILSDVAAVPVARQSELSCPRRETLKTELDLRFDGDYRKILRTSDDKSSFRKAAEDQLSKTARLLLNNLRVRSLTSGSIIVGLTLEKKVEGDGVDLPASAFELKNAARKRTLSINFRGETLRASASQNFQERNEGATVSSVVGGGGGGGGGIGATVGAVVAVITIVAVVAVVAFIIVRRHRQNSEIDSSQMYETMSNASCSTKDGGANYDNQIYAGIDDDINAYDNMESQQAASNA